jgi:predicted amidophosphoribosyltransferase
MLGKRLRDHYLTNYIWPPENYILLPVPLHPAKKRMRGFNQARLIATGIGKATGIDVADDGVARRTRNTRSQTGFSVDKRMHNVHGAFEISASGHIKGKAVIIVDDVFTTGATTFELAMQCWQSGAVTCLIATVAQA